MNQKTKIKLEDLKVSSFVTKVEGESTRGGATFVTCGPPTCAAACGPTDGVHICKEP